MSTSRIPDLVAALSELREQFRCDSVSSSYVTDDGALITVNVYRSLATITDEDGHVQPIPLVLG